MITKEQIAKKLGYTAKPWIVAYALAQLRREGKLSSEYLGQVYVYPDEALRLVRDKLAKAKGISNKSTS